MVHNLEILKGVMNDTGCKILLAQKAFSMYATYPLISQYLSGTTASGLYEARLGAEHFPGEVHVYSPAYREDEFEEIMTYAEHFVFNSVAQVKKYGPKVKSAGKSVLLRVNPQCSTQDGHEIYDPCAPGSRMGTTLENFDEEILPLLDGLHFHTLCEQDATDLQITVDAFRQQFGKYLGQMKYLNLGGGHHITKDGYHLELLKQIINSLQDDFQVQVYLEPGEAVVYQAGFLVTKVLEILENELQIAILDCSAACHMPDVIEMPYRPPLMHGSEAGTTPYTYRLGGPTCLAGDVIGDYAFEGPLEIGDELIFEDMALYTMVKTNTFNGMALPSIAYRKSDGQVQIVREFSYADFKNRLS